MRVVHGEVGHDDGDGEGDSQHAADGAQAAHDHAQVCLNEKGGRRTDWSFLLSFCYSYYRVTHHVVPNLPLTTKQKLCSSKEHILKHNFCFHVNGRLEPL